MPHHLIFEGAELTGKSWIIAQIYDFIERKYNQDKKTLNGCHWFNCDNNIFGTEHGNPCIQKYIEILRILNNKNVIFEKLHLSDMVYNKIFRNVEIDYRREEKKLFELETKIILCTIKEDISLISKRIQERLKSIPHFRRVMQSPEWYINQQREYLKEIKKTKLPYLIVDMTEIPNKKHLNILKWIGEK